jgi:hypothetical protein
MYVWTCIHRNWSYIYMHVVEYLCARGCIYCVHLVVYLCARGRISACTWWKIFVHVTISNCTWPLTKYLSEICFNQMFPFPPLSLDDHLILLVRSVSTQACPVLLSPGSVCDMPSMYSMLSHKLAICQLGIG